MPKHHKTSPHYSTHYQVGLGKEILFRSRIIFLGLIGLLFLSSGSAIYAGVKNGSIQKNIIQPSKELFSAIGESFKESSESAKPNYGQIININNGPGTSEIIIESSSTPTSTKSTTQTTTKQNTNSYTIPSKTPSYQYNTKSYEQSVQEMNERADKAYQEALKKQQEWSEQKKAENKKWFEQQTQKSEADSKSWFDQKAQENQQKLEQWKKEHGF